MEILQGKSINRALVFTRTKHGADKVVRGLMRGGIVAQAIHGNKSQNERERVLAAFRKGTVRTLVATDIAARGIDVDGISHVVNFDLPNVPETYVHRIGRTARAGAAGVAISLCAPDELAFLRDIEKLIRLSIPASDHRSYRAQSHPGTAKRRPARAAVQPHGKHRQRRRQNASDKQDRYEQRQNISGGLAAVAFLHRAVPASRNANPRSVECGSRKG